MKPRRLLTYGAEAAVILTGLLIVPWLPRRAVLALARGITALSWRADRTGRRVGMANLDLVYGDTLTAAAKADILRQAMFTFNLAMLDLLWFTWRGDARVRRHVTVTGDVAGLLAAAPALIVTAHFGNWDLMGRVAALHDAPCLAIAAPMRSPLTHWLLGRLRGQGGQTVVSKRGALLKIRAHLRARGRLALLLDQNTVPRHGGVFEDFFGLPVPIANILPLLTRLCPAPVCCVFCHTDPRTGNYRIDVQAPLIVGQAGVTRDSLNRLVLSRIEATVRADPGQWLWTYKRWKYPPPGRGLAGYPPYASELKSYHLAV